MSILMDLRNYLAERKRASLKDLAMHFDTTDDAMRGMLEKWEQKGKVTHCAQPNCGGCSTGCASEPGEIYEWVDP